jgi:hypothetical protein
MEICVECLLKKVGSVCVSHNCCHGNTTVHSICIVELHIAQETTICHSPPVYSFAGDSKNLTSPYYTNM